MIRIGLVLLSAALAACAYLGYRVFALEQRVSGLVAQVGTPAPAGEGGEQAREGGHTQRLAALERELEALRADLRTLERATADMTGGPGLNLDDPSAQKRILSVVDRKQSRIRDRHLEFHRERWLEWRTTALDDFAANQALSPAQTDKLHQLLADEIDALVELLRSPLAEEDPEKAAHEWLNQLEATDRAAHRVLDPTQIEAWDIARELERRVFWPWLPNR